jgi:hypothetical protein
MHSNARATPKTGKGGMQPAFEGVGVVPSEEGFQGDEVVVVADEAAVRHTLVGVVESGLVGVGVERADDLDGLRGHRLGGLWTALLALPGQAWFAVGAADLAGAVNTCRFRSGIRVIPVSVDTGPPVPRNG